MVVSVALLAVPAASAKIWFKGIGGKTVEPGQLIRTSVPGCGIGNCGVLRGIRVFVVRTTSPSSADTPPRPRRFVGRIAAAGKLTFRVPRVSAGRYRLVAYVTWSKPAQFLPASPDFRVVLRR